MVLPLPFCALVPLAAGVGDVLGAGTAEAVSFDMALLVLLVVLLLIPPEVTLLPIALSVLLPTLLSVPLVEFVRPLVELPTELSVELLVALSVELEVSLLLLLEAELSVLLLVSVLLVASLPVALLPVPDELRLMAEGGAALFESSEVALLLRVKYQMAAPTSANANNPATHLDVLFLSPANRGTVVSCLIVNCR